MKSKTVLGCLTVLFLAVSPVAGLAQRAGFQVGITQSPFALAPMQNPVGGTRGSFNLVPRFVPPPTTIGPIIPLVPNFPTVIVPNQVLPGQTLFLPEQGFFPGTRIFPRTNVHSGPGVLFRTTILAAAGGESRFVDFLSGKSDSARLAVRFKSHSAGAIRFGCWSCFSACGYASSRSAPPVRTAVGECYYEYR
jgi:hypothetical protein